MLPVGSREPQRAESAPTAEECAKWLAFTDWNALNSLQAVQLLFSQPPFSSQLDAKVRDTEIRAQIYKLQGKLASGGWEKAIAIYRQAEDSNDDVVLRMNFGFLLLVPQEIAEAIENFEFVQRKMPHHPAPHVLLGQVHASQGRIDDALRECRAALRLRPEWPQALELLEQLSQTRSAN